MLEQQPRGFSGGSPVPSDGRGAARDALRRIVPPRLKRLRPDSCSRSPSRPRTDLPRRRPVAPPWRGAYAYGWLPVAGCQLTARGYENQALTGRLNTDVIRSSMFPVMVETVSRLDALTLRANHRLLPSDIRASALRKALVAGASVASFLVSERRDRLAIAVLSAVVLHRHRGRRPARLSSGSRRFLLKGDVGVEGRTGHVGSIRFRFSCFFLGTMRSGGYISDLRVGSRLHSPWRDRESVEEGER